MIVWCRIFPAYNFPLNGGFVLPTDEKSRDEPIGIDSDTTLMYSYSYGLGV